MGITQGLIQKEKVDIYGKKGAQISVVAKHFVTQVIQVDSSNLSLNLSHIRHNPDHCTVLKFFFYFEFFYLKIFLNFFIKIE